MFIKFEKCTCNMSHGPHGSFCYYMLSMGYMLPTVYHELLHNFAGSLILVGGDPGVGKSSLILQLASIMSENIGAGESSAIVYVSGEESIEQIGNRADRMSIKSRNLYLYSSTDIEVTLFGWH
jgi:energy-coupling factor transporter ATP-binding protein EcfA2